MSNDEKAVWLIAGLRTPFGGVDGPFANRDSLALSVPVVPAMAPQANGPIDFAVWGSVVLNLAYANLAREVWLESKLDPHVPTYTTIMQCSTSMVGVFEAAWMLGQKRAQLALVGGVESMSRVQIGLGQNLSVWLCRMFQARSVTQRFGLFGTLRPSDIRIHVPEVKNRVTGRRPALTSLAPNPCAREARRAIDVGQQSDPRSERPAGAAWAALRLLTDVDGDNGCHP